MNRFCSIVLCSLFVLSAGCTRTAPVESVSGTKMAKVDKVDVDKDGLTIEQKNIGQRIKQDNKQGAIKHLYVISTYSGQVIIYSTVNGKVTSSGKRLTPKRVRGTPQNTNYDLPTVEVGGRLYTTDELLGEDGTVGDSIEYLYWWDSKGIYHQHYINGGQILHISDQPLTVKGIIINMEVTTHGKESEEAKQ